MGKVTDKELFQSLKENKLDDVYFFYGDEEYFLKLAISKIKKILGIADNDSLSLSTFDGENFDIDMLKEAVYSVSMFSEQRKLVILKNVPESISENNLKGLVEIINDPFELTCLIVYSTINFKDVEKSSKLKKIITATNKSGTVASFNQKDKVDLKRAICDKAKANLVKIDPWDADYLIERCGTSYTVLLNEMDKLISFKEKGGEITKEDIDLITIRSLDASAFHIVKNLLWHKFDTVYGIITDLLQMGQKPIAIIIALSMAITDIYRAKCGLNVRATEKDIATDFKYPQNRLFVISNSMKDAGKYQKEQIHKCIYALYEANRLIITTSNDGETILFQTIGKMIEAIK